MKDICRDTRLADGVLICNHQGVFIEDIQGNSHKYLKMVIVPLKCAILYNVERGNFYGRRISKSMKDKKLEPLKTASVGSTCDPPKRGCFENFQEKFLRTTSRCHLCITHRTYPYDAICRGVFTQGRLSQV